MKLVHPYDTKKAQTLVMPPPLKLKTCDMMFKASGVQFVLAAKYFSCQKLVYAVFGNGEKLWVDSREINGIRWCMTGQPVVIPEEFFWSHKKIDPFFYLRLDSMDNFTQVKFSNLLMNSSCMIIFTIKSHVSLLLFADA